MIYRTSEWVSPGHPDKVADCISEYILDRLLEIDPDVRYALEVQIKGNKISLAGEITTLANIDDSTYRKWTKDAVNLIGYTKDYQDKWGSENTICDADLEVSCNISQQSPEIAQGVNNNGWGDQGIFTGYAEINDLDNEMPYDKELARKIGLFLYENALINNIGGLDIKTQVTVDEFNSIKQIIVAIPLLESDMEGFFNYYNSFLKCEGIDVSDAKMIVNGTGVYKQHGPIADSGTTGRKLAVDFYGNNSPIGGGCPWTKDPSKADLTLNLYARKRAIQELFNKKVFDRDAHHCIYQLCCCIGQSKLLGTGKIFDKDDRMITEFSQELDIKPSELIEKYDLKKPIYFNLCKYGLFEDISKEWNKFGD